MSGALEVTEFNLSSGRFIQSANTDLSGYHELGTEVMIVNKIDKNPALKELTFNRDRPMIYTYMIKSYFRVESDVLLKKSYGATAGDCTVAVPSIAILNWVVLLGMGLQNIR